MSYFNTHMRHGIPHAKRRACLILTGALCLTAFAGSSEGNQSDEFTKLAANAPGAEIHNPSTGNLRRLHLEGKDGHYNLNAVELPSVSKESICFSTANHAYKVRIRLLKTVLVSYGEPKDHGDSELVKSLSQNIPMVARILKQEDSVGSLKVVTYDLIRPKSKQDIQLLEQLTLLWSADPAQAKRVGQTGFGPLMRFSEQVVDVQYRTPNFESTRLFKKIFLQIFYIQRGDNRMTLGSFVIVSNPNGDYEFYLVPRILLDRIVVENKLARRHE